MCEAGCLTIRRGELGDVWESDLAVSNGTWAAGSYPSTWTGFSQSNHRTVMKFDTSVVPDYAYVTSATVQIFELWAQPVSTVRAHQVVVPWDEATVTWPNFGASDATFLPEVVASFQAGSGGGTKSFDLTALAAAWVAGTAPNEGILLEQDLGGTTELHSYLASESSQVSKRPALTVCYDF